MPRVHLVALWALLLVCPAAASETPLPAEAPPPAPAPAVAPSVPAASTGVLEVHFLDVGQGDATFIRSPTGKTVLIDGGPPEAAQRLASRVAALTSSAPLDLVILTHPHLDHLGGLEAVLDRTGAKRFLEPDFDHPTASTTRLRQRVNSLGIQKQLARFPTLEEETKAAPEGAEARFKSHKDQLQEIGLGDGVVLEILWPREHAQPFLKNTRSDANANSIVARLRYGTTAFLLTGDAEEDTEKMLLQSRRNLRADVLKVAHHGSRHSSTLPFLRAVRPRVAVISAGRHNDYGHPHVALLQRLQDVDARVMRTDRDGEVVVRSNGKRISYQTHDRHEADEATSARPTPSAAEATSYVASSRSKVFHRGDCPNTRYIAPTNLVTFKTRDEAAAKLQPAKDCNP